MMLRAAISLFIVANCTACGGRESAPTNEAAASNKAVADASHQSLGTIAPDEPSDLPEGRSPVAESPIDPRSGKAAGQVLQSYAALLEQERWAEARRLWTQDGAGSGHSEAAFKDAYSKFAEIHAEIGAPGPVEGAAGSAYVEIPLRIYGRLKGGRTFSSTGSATLRRVNDVPGSTAEQRRWHIYRVDVKPTL